MKIPQRIEDVFIITRVAVEKESNGEQSPQEWSKIRSRFFLIKPVYDNYANKSKRDKSAVSKDVASVESSTDNKNRGENSDTKIVIEGGSFMMGSDKGYEDEVPLHKVTLGNYLLGKHEVTNKEFCKFLNEKGNKVERGKKWINVTDADCTIKEKNGKFYPKKDFEDKPVVKVNWHGANAYCKWIGGRLPTEAEWEYAARSGGKENYYLKNPNELGIFGMLDDFYEWCADWYYNEYYKNSAKENPKGLPNGKEKVYRGGSPFQPATRRTTRLFYPPATYSARIGFRVCYDN